MAPPRGRGVRRRGGRGGRGQSGVTAVGRRRESVTNSGITLTSAEAQRILQDRRDVYSHVQVIMFFFYFWMFSFGVVLQPQPSYIPYKIHKNSFIHIIYKNCLLISFGSYIQSLVDQLNEEKVRELLAKVVSNQPGMVLDLLHLVDPARATPEDPPEPTGEGGQLPWCSCNRCREMPTAEERVCCGHSPEHCTSQLPVSMLKGVTD